MGYSVFRIDDVANRRGEDFLNRIVSAFSCVKNREVDEFLAYLVAQIGKNATLSKRDSIGGVQLLELAKNEIRAAQERVGGQMVFLEMEHGNAFLESFYHVEFVLILAFCAAIGYAAREAGF